MARDKKKDDDKGGLDRAAFKHAIGMIESSGGKFLDSEYSSAAGKYHFLYSLIKNDPDMKGISKRQFINNPELQERIMDKAISGELSGYVGYESNARSLKSQFDTDLSVTEIAALTHFLGARGARNYLTDPNKYSTPGKVNATPQKYIDLFRKHSMPTEDQPIPKNTNRPFISDESARQMEQPKDAVNINTPQPRKELQGLQFKENTKIDTGALPEFKSNDQKEPNVIPISEQVEGGTPSGLKVLSDMVDSFADGGTAEVNPSKKLIEFNTGGTHAQNPLGGIPIGVGSNGKLNTVEEGETQFGDYIFSNRFGMGGKTNEYKCGGKMKKMADGGDTDPPSKESQKKIEDESKEFSKDWVDSPVTRARLSENTGKRPYELIDTVNEFKSNIDNLPESQFNAASSKETEGAEFKGGQIRYYRDVNPADSTHEIFHGSGMDDVMDPIIKERFGLPAAALQKRHGLDYNESLRKEYGLKDNMFDNRKLDGIRTHLNSLSNKNEIYPRIMEMRRIIKAKPGQKIEQKDIDVIKKEMKDDSLFRAYGDDAIKEMLNTLASTDSKQEQTEYRLS